MPEDGPAVARLREAGAVILGKTTTPEFGWKAIGDSPLTGITRNPWNLDAHAGRQQRRRRRRLRRRHRAVACRQRRRRLDPHPVCLYRHFRHQGDVRPGAGASASPMGLLSNIGPMTRSVRDAALMLNVLARPDHRDPYALPPERRMYLDGIEDGVRGWRIAYSPDLGYAPAGHQSRSRDRRLRCATAAQRFEELGAHVEQVGADLRLAARRRC